MYSTQTASCALLAAIMAQTVSATPIVNQQLIFNDEVELSMNVDETAVEEGVVSENPAIAGALHQMPTELPGTGCCRLYQELNYGGAYDEVCTADVVPTYDTKSYKSAACAPEAFLEIDGLGEDDKKFAIYQIAVPDIGSIEGATAFTVRPVTAAELGKWKISHFHSFDSCDGYTMVIPFDFTDSSETRVDEGHYMFSDLDEILSLTRSVTL